MSLDELYDFPDVFDIGVPPDDRHFSSSSQDPQEVFDSKKRAIKDACVRYLIWLVGLIIGFIPATALPMLKLFGGEFNGFGSFISALFCQSEILFMSVSLSISANNDATVHNKKGFMVIWRLVAFILIVLGAISFTVLAVMEYLKLTISQNVVMWFGLILFALTLVGGSVPYIVAICNHIKNMSYGEYGEDDNHD